MKAFLLKFLKVICNIFQFFSVLIKEYVCKNKDINKNTVSLDTEFTLSKESKFSVKAETTIAVDKSKSNVAELVTDEEVHNDTESINVSSES